MFCSVPMVYVHISSRKRANKQMSTNILQRWILRNIIEQLIMTKSSVKFNPENDINVKLQIFNFTFHAITSISSIRICHEHQRLEFIYHTPFIFLGLVTSTVIFSTEDSCWHSRASQCDLQHDIRHTMAFFCLSEKCADAVHSIPENRSA